LEGLFLEGILPGEGFQQKAHSAFLSGWGLTQNPFHYFGLGLELKARLGGGFIGTLLAQNWIIRL